LAGEGSELQLTLGAGDPKWLVRPAEGEEPKNTKKVEKTMEPLPDFSLALVDSLGQSAIIAVGEVKKIAPRLLSRFTKLPFWEKQWAGDPWEVQLQSVHIPLAKFRENNPEINLGRIQKIQLIFDKTPTGVIVLDGLGYEPGG
jgi:hypothetical protein